MRKIFLIYTFLFASLIVKSQVFPVDLADSIQEIIDNAVVEYDLKGVAGSVILADNSQWTGSSGIASEGVPIDTSRLFLFGSLTKTFVAATIMQLYEEGNLTLSDSIGKYIGPFINIDGSEPIRDLLNMSTGYYDFTDNQSLKIAMYLYPDSIFTTEQVLDNYILEPILNEDNHLIYRNTNYLLLGLIVESITGNPFGEEIENRFFNPLHLSNTFFVPVDLTEDDTNGAWGDLGNGFQYIGDRSPNSILSVFGAAGGLVSTPQQMAKWIKALHEGEFLNQSSLDSMRTLLNGNEYADGYYFLGQGLGTQAMQFDGNVLYGHKGNVIHHSLTLYSLEKQVAISYVINHESQASLDVTCHDIFKEVINYFENTTNVSADIKWSQLAFPNPVKNTLNIKPSGFDHEKSLKISIVDYKGNILMQTFNDGFAEEILVDFSEFKPGNYIVVLQQEDMQVSIQIFKE